MSSKKNILIISLICVALVPLEACAQGGWVRSYVKRPNQLQQQKQNKTQKFDKAETSLEDDITIDVKDTKKLKIEKTEPVKTLEGEFSYDNPDKLKKAFEIQKKKDIEDITVLWESTVERNSVIKFAVKKLALPPEQRKVHSSVMARSVSTLISGASLMPGIFGMNSVASTASAAGGSLASRIIRKKASSDDVMLTDTELIQLAGLVEELQNKIIKSYYDYKGSIESLKECRSKLMLYNKNYSKALKAKNEANILVTSAMYDNQLVEEIKLKQKIKLHRLELERLAGTEVVSSLNLTKLDKLVDFENNSDLPNTASSRGGV